MWNVRGVGYLYANWAESNVWSWIHFRYHQHNTPFYIFGVFNFFWIKMWNRLLCCLANVTNSLYNLYHTTLATLHISHHQEAVSACRLLSANWGTIEEPCSLGGNSQTWKCRMSHLKGQSKCKSLGLCIIQLQVRWGVSPEITNNFMNMFRYSDDNDACGELN